MQHTVVRTAPQPVIGPEWLEAFIGSIASIVETRLRHEMAVRNHQEQERRRPATPGSPFLTVSETAAFLRCKPQRVYDLLTTRTLNRYKDGTRTLIKRTELEMYVTSAENARLGALRATGRS
jgi:excisionase family DNA binding protein